MDPGINGKTGIVGLIGYPVSHSFSPQIHNTLFRDLELNFVYLPFPVKSGRLYNALQGVQEIGVKGFNVTVPYKEKIIPLLDEVNKDAHFVGAVNTVDIRDNKLYGYNTDVSGFASSLDEAGISAAGKKAVVLGAGGAARAVIAALAEKNISKIYILNRTLSKAQSLAEEFYKELNISIIPYSMNDGNCSEIIAQSNLVINTTSVGMEKTKDKSLIPQDLLSSGQSVIDIIYNPPKTLLLKNAEQKGCRILNGLGMLINQAVHSFEIWTGVKPEKDKIYSLF